MNANTRDAFRLQNPFFKRDDGVLYHLGLEVKKHDLPSMFGDVRFVCMGGAARRMKEFARYIATILKIDLPDGKLVNLAKEGNRYVLYKIGPVLSVSHGMGLPSMTILLHEIIMLMDYAGTVDPIFLRMGTSGGIGITEGTVVVSSEVVNDYLEPYFELPMLLKKIRRPAVFDQELVNELISVSKEIKNDGFSVVAGKTLSTDHFYECTGITTGAICEYTESEKMEYYKSLNQHKVINIDMEVLALAAITHHVGIKSAAITVVSNDHLSQKNESFSKEAKMAFERRPQIIIGRYIKKALTESS